MIAAALHIWWVPVGLVAAWRIDVNLNPFRPCSRCGGSGKTGPLSHGCPPGGPYDGGGPGGGWRSGGPLCGGRAGYG